MAAAAGMSVMTLRSLERGGDGVTMGAYLAVMAVLGIERDLDELAAAAFLSGIDDPQGVIGGAGPQAPDDDWSGAARHAPTSPARAAEADNSPSVVAAGKDRAMPDLAAAPVPPGDTSSEPGFEWLDAPARDLRRLVQLDGGTVGSAGQGPVDHRDATPDLFAAPRGQDAS